MLRVEGENGNQRAMIRTRFAPSPTGDLHLGGASCALASFVLARASGGRFVVRVEDLDPPRVVAGSAERILEDLAWLGLMWDEGPNLATDGGAGERGDRGPYAQSARSDLYRAAVDELSAAGLVYPCDCSRAELARAASAPHAGEELVYPGTCRNADPRRAMKREPALRVRVPEGVTVRFVDGVVGETEQRLDTSVGDFVIVRGDGVFAYQLAVLVDDVAMGITDVVRGADLLGSTPRQIFLGRALGHDGSALPRYHHLPLVLDHEGQRLAKRTPGAHVRALREHGVSRDAILGVLAHGLGLSDDDGPRALDEVVARGARFAPRPVRVPAAWAALGADQRDRSEK